MPTSTPSAISPSAPVRQAMEMLDRTAAKIVVVLEDDRLIGVVSDGDIRRAYLRHDTLDLSVAQVMNRRPIVAQETDGAQRVLTLMRNAEIQQIPLVDETGRLVKVVSLQDVLGWHSGYSNTVVLMAGGFGKRLGKITEKQPKPLVNVGGRPILETIIFHFRHHGFTRFIISTHYLAEMIKEYFGDGSRLGVEIEYVQESSPLGTAGALSLIEKPLTAPFFVMNGDLLTDLNFARMMDSHTESKALLTVASLLYSYQVPYGVLENEGRRIKRITEKPNRQALISAGVYVLSPAALEHVPRGEYTDMPTLIERCIKAGNSPHIYPMTENWLDIGRPNDLELAQQEYVNYFGHIKDFEGGK
ncbi:MAG: nucleotidyltransferase family protein [Hyphomicrobiaceae bacterium]|nr:nucleotidyltransferase family protein [Hyphomicrobiaceae bacterium]